VLQSNDETFEVATVSRILGCMQPHILQCFENAKLEHFHHADSVDHAIQMLKGICTPLRFLTFRCLLFDTLTIRLLAVFTYLPTYSVLNTDLITSYCLHWLKGHWLWARNTTKSLTRRQTRGYLPDCRTWWM